MTEPTNLQRCMWAENVLCHFDEDVRVGGGMGLRRVDDLYDPPDEVAQDLITDICHFLHMDERAGMKTPAEIMELLERAFRRFESEQEQEKR